MVFAGHKLLATWGFPKDSAAAMMNRARIGPDRILYFLLDSMDFPEFPISKGLRLAAAGPLLLFGNL